MRMVGFMRNRLGRCEATDHEDANNQEAREGALDDAVCHSRLYTSI